jgi:hypothetical protein
MPIPTIQFGSDKPFGDLTGWNYTSASVTTDKERATAADSIGNEVASRLYDEKISVTASLVAASASAPDVPTEIGAYLGAYILTSIQISTSRDGFVTMTLTGHNHAVNPHSGASGEKTVAHGITLASGFGALDFMEGTAGSNASVRSGTITIECQHTDETDASGDHLVGENYQPMLTAETEWVGVPTTPADTGWDVTSKPNPTENTGFESASYSGTKALAFTA